MAHAEPLEFEGDELKVHATDYRFADVSVNRQTDADLYKNSYMSFTTYGKRLRAARKDARLTQKQLADKVGLKQATISELENDEYDGSAKTAAIADVLGVNALWLAEGKGDPAANQRSRETYDSAVGEASDAARTLIDAILRADKSGEPAQTFALMLRMLPDPDEPFDIEAPAP
ncbi:helix-turn-helix domain-containing protein [Burkholderia multivorans]|uniref:helix-turn-helix domain-containing protein n=1 Tax=Burkholderia multivorans TaxID=87883 RepID=UPI002019D879|nr:helix-turn-helix transcriptional regulator [Burkholderia multivorans]MCO1402857.1 helix-turn-helix domain-containing protein [Burkholderia multivorans]UQO78618.1 helix-turn-helix domain-containing protein [Burkholderia multivorans]